MLRAVIGANAHRVSASNAIPAPSRTVGTTLRISQSARVAAASSVAGTVSSGISCVVMVEFPRPGVYSLGFATGEMTLDLPGGGHKKLISVYIPTNHVYIGDVIFVPAEQVIPSHLSVQQGIQAALSAGAILK